MLHFIEIHRDTIHKHCMRKFRQWSRVLQSRYDTPMSTRLIRTAPRTQRYAKNERRDVYDSYKFDFDDATVIVNIFKKGHYSNSGMDYEVILDDVLFVLRYNSTGNRPERSNALAKFAYGFIQRYRSEYGKWDVTFPQDG